MSGSIGGGGGGQPGMVWTTGGTAGLPPQSYHQQQQQQLPVQQQAHWASATVVPVPSQQAAPVASVMPAFGQPQAGHSLAGGGGGAVVAAYPHTVQPVRQQHQQPAAVASYPAMPPSQYQQPSQPSMQQRQIATFGGTAAGPGRVKQQSWAGNNSAVTGVGNGAGSGASGRGSKRGSQRGSSRHTQQGTSKKWHDVWWLLGLLLNIAVIAFFAYRRYSAADLAASLPAAPGATVGIAMTRIVVASSLVGVLLGSLVLLLLLSCPSAVIHCTLWLAVLMMAAWGGYLIAFGSMLFGFLACLAAICFAYIVCNAGSSIAFAACLLDAAALAVKAHTSLVFMSLVLLVPQALWLAAWGIVMLPLVSTGFGVLFFLALVSYFWTSNAIKHVMTVTTTGVVGDWARHIKPKTSLCVATGQAMTVHLGSISFASLIMAFVAALRRFIALLRATDDSAFCGCFLCMFACCLSALDHWMRLITRFTLIYACLFDEGFWHAGKGVSDALQASDAEAIVSQDLTSVVIYMADLLVGCIAGAAASVAVSGQGSEWIVVAGVAGFLIGGSIAAQIASIALSSSATLLIMLLEEPEVFHAHRSAAFTVVQTGLAEFLDAGIEDQQAA